MKPTITLELDPKQSRYLVAAPPGTLVDPVATVKQICKYLSISFEGLFLQGGPRLVQYLEGESSEGTVAQLWQYKPVTAYGGEGVEWVLVVETAECV